MGNLRGEGKERGGRGRNQARVRTELHRTRARLLHRTPPLALDGTIPYELGWALRVPRDGGVYLIHDLRGVLYVGLSVDLWRRFDEHADETSNPLLREALSRPLGQTQFSWRQVPDLAEQIRIERQLIQAFRPLCNRLQYTADSTAY